MGMFETDRECIRQREYVGIPAWHKAGYKGKGITVLHDDTGDTNHSVVCADYIQTILPEATIIRGLIGGTSDNDGIQEAYIKRFDTGERLDFDEAITKWNITQINNSTDGGKNDNNSRWAVYMREKIKQYNLICTGGAGNLNGLTNPFQGAFIIVGGVYSDLRKYGSSGDAIDFVMHMGFQNGTSFSGPFLNGMCGLLRSKNPDMTQGEIYEYFKSHCQDLGVSGKDMVFGWGLPIMGDPNESIDPGDENTKYEKIQALLGRVPVEVDGRKETIRTINYNGENWFRLRDYDEILKIAKVDYDALRKLPIIKD